MRVKPKTKLALFITLVTAILITGCVGQKSFITFTTNVTGKDAAGREIEILPGAYSGEQYTWTISPQGGTEPYNCSLSPGSSLPGTLQFVGCTVRGTAPPVLTDTFFPFSFTITDANGTRAGPFELSLPVRLRPPELILPPILRGARIGQDYEYVLCDPISQSKLDCGGGINPSGGVPPYVFLPASGLPLGLTMEPNGEIRGKVPEAYREGERDVEICIVDSRRFQTCRQTKLPVVAQAALAFTPSPPVTCTAGQFCSVAMVAGVRGGLPPYNFRFGSGIIPEDMALNEDGVLTGTPARAGVYNFELCAVDSEDAASCERTSLVVSPPAKPSISLSTGELIFTAAEGLNPSPKSFVITNRGSTASYLNFTITEQTGKRAVVSPAAGSLAYLESITISVSIDTAGLRSAGYRGTITVSDPEAANSPQTVEVRLIIYLPTTPTPAPTVSMPTLIVQVPDNLPAGTLGRNYEYTFSVSGGIPPYSIDWMVGLPFGLKEEGITIKGIINPDWNVPSNYGPMQLCIKDAAGERYCVSTNLPIRAP